MDKTPKLTIELVPETSWCSNVRTILTKRNWDKVRRQVYKNANYLCEICKRRGDDHPVEAHEVWQYDDFAGTQTLQRMIALCPDCHEVKHIGLANANGRLPDAAYHLARVNAWTVEQTAIYIDEQFDVWRRRSLINWVLDIELLSQYGIKQ